MRRPPICSPQYRHTRVFLQYIEFIKLIQDRIDIIQVSTGVNPPGPGSKAYVMSTGFFGETPFVDLPGKVKANPGINIPVAAVGGIHRPEVAERLLAEGYCDIVTTVRGLYYPDKR